MTVTAMYMISGCPHRGRSNAGRSLGLPQHSGDLAPIPILRTCGYASATATSAAWAREGLEYQHKESESTKKEKKKCPSYHYPGATSTYLQAGLRLFVKCC
jgi:hypothetical protein